MKAKASSAHPPIRPSAYAGIDAGGSHTEAVIVDSERRVLGRARGAPGALRPDNATAVATVIAETLGDASKNAGKPTIASLVVAAAGAGRAAERTALEKALRKHKLATKVKVIGDGEAALESAFPNQSGIVILSGTGSIAYARDRSGNLRRVGGLGPQLGDEGGGFALGRAALGAAGKAADGRGPATILLEKIHHATNTADLDNLIRWAQGASREQVAALAQTACVAALEGDPIARELVEHAAHELAQHAVALLRRLSPETPGGVALGGRLLASDSPVRHRLVAALNRVAPQMTITDTAVDTGLGAASLAIRS